MITYGLLNLGSFYESVTKNQSYRPTFKYCHWTVSLAGAIGCLAVMFLINWVWAGVSIIVIAALHGAIRFHEIESRVGDLRSGVAFERARKSLLRLEQDGIESLVQCHGIGGFRPNTILLGWPGSLNRSASFGASLRVLSRLGRSIIAVRFREEADPRDPWAIPDGTIDVWWRGRKNGGLLLAHLLHQNPEWRKRPIRMLRVVKSADGIFEVVANINFVCERARISAQPVVIASDDPPTVIQSASAQSAIVIMGFQTPIEGEEAVFVERMEKTAGKLARVLFVSSAGGMELDS